MVERPLVITWKHLGTIVGALGALVVIGGGVHGCIALPNLLEEVMPRVDQRIEAHSSRSHRTTEEAFERIRERLTILETRLDELRGRGARGEVGR